MLRIKTKIVIYKIWPVIIIFLVLFSTAPLMSSSLIYKNYIVRYDRGWDILCEPYVVKKNDWILKIFRQKGEIAHKDFRDFNGIFKRLNPHIKDIDLIRPGQSIDIPLRKLEHGSLPGQASGVVTIPFVALTEVSTVIKKHSKHYTVQKGDTVSRLLARKYGNYGSKSYLEGVKLFKAANPHVTNLNRIYAGEKLYLPDPSIRQKEWYASMYNAQGKLKKTVNKKDGPPAPKERRPPLAKPVPQRVKPKGPLAEAAALTGGRLQNKGTYYLPRNGEKDFEMDLSKHPMLEFNQGSKIVFTPNDKIMGIQKDEFKANWPQTKPISVDPQWTTEQYVSAIFGTLEEGEQTTEELTFEQHGVRVAVRAKWTRTESEGRKICITPISEPAQQTSESIRRYLEQNGIVLKEILPGGKAIEHTSEKQNRHSVKNVLALSPSSQRDFLKILSKALGFSYSPNTSITFPYAGIQVEAFSNLISTQHGQEALVDFGDLYGDAVISIEKTGLKVVQINADDTYDTIVQKLFSALSIDFEKHPTLLAAQRSAEYNTAITIYGLLLLTDENRRMLLTSATLHSAVTDMLSNQGIDVVVW